jgi:nitrile hydratase accessory protein
LTRPDAAADRPTFEEPWQAEAFALAVHLSAAGAFAWPDWAAALAAEISAAGADDDGHRYYEHWLAALERLAFERCLVAPAAFAERKAAWAEAYRRTPHGQPVTLAAARRG